MDFTVPDAAYTDARGRQHVVTLDVWLEGSSDTPGDFQLTASCGSFADDVLFSGNYLGSELDRDYGRNQEQLSGLMDWLADTAKRAGISKPA